MASSVDAESAPRVSVILPCFDYGHYLDHAVRSLQRQTLGDWECIVVDDGSTDNTAEIARELALKDRRIRLVRQTNLGLSAARNAGIRQARGTYLQFLDADDALEERKLEVQTRYLDANPGDDLVAGPARFFGEGASARARIARQLPDLPTLEGGQFVRSLLRGNFLVVNSLLLRRTSLSGGLAFDESLSALEDWDLWLRLALRGRRLAIRRDHGSAALVRVHSASMSHDDVRMLMAAVQVRAKLAGDLHEGPDRRLNSLLRGESEGWLGARLGIHESPSVGVRYLLAASQHTANPKYLAWAAILPLARTSYGRRIGTRLYPGLFNCDASSRDTKSS